jgi:hypothetical protein
MNPNVGDEQGYPQSAKTILIILDKREIRVRDAIGSQGPWVELKSIDMTSTATPNINILNE